MGNRGPLGLPGAVSNRPVGIGCVIAGYHDSAGHCAPGSFLRLAGNAAAWITATGKPVPDFHPVRHRIHNRQDQVLEREPFGEIENPCAVPGRKQIVAASTSVNRESSDTVNVPQSDRPASSEMRTAVKPSYSVLAAASGCHASAVD